MRFTFIKDRLFDESFSFSIKNFETFVTQIPWLALARARTPAMDPEYDACAWRAY